MISKEEIKKLADLARIEVSETEAESLGKDMDAILDYVGQVKSVANSGLSREAVSGAAKEDEVNVMREDANPTESSAFSKELIAGFPNAQGNYLKVKKIL